MWAIIRMAQVVLEGGALSTDHNVGQAVAGAAPTMYATFEMGLQHVVCYHCIPRIGKQVPSRPWCMRVCTKSISVTRRMLQKMCQGAGIEGMVLMAIW